ncbi:MAG: LemA family protein [Bacteroidales bacterium]|nr:LemA family protein [Bacteroidales bacterium]
MSKSTLILIVVLAVIALWGVSTYNSLVSSDESVTNAWSQVENVYQRRMDLIPNLVKTVQGAADFERNTLNDVIEARSKASSVQLDANSLTEENLAAFQQAQDGLSAALSRLMVVVERYPELKANQNFLELQSQLEGTENRITVERQKYNDVVRTYNAGVRRFPRNIIASLFNFDPKAYFKAAEGADKAPSVDFNF